ncbi:DUF4097 family beta strand repeat-containing protein [Anaerorhabdus sp.]|uniref:DUF4097 family beta strand repeat-containing protein n=1 Tax=Anaerorhabdus sp. TaxID=1872524 RepID=UPI002FCBC48C
MKKILITKLVVLSILLIVVCGIASTAFIGYKTNWGFFSNRDSVKNELVKEERFSNIENIKVNVVEESIVVYEHNSNDVVVKYYGNKDRVPVMNATGNDLRIEREKEWYFFVFNFGYSGRVEIYAPSDQINKLDLSNVSGSVDVQPDIKDLFVDTVSGNIEGQASGIDADLNTVSGNIRMYGTFNEIDAETVSGNIRLKTEANSKLTASTVSGTVRCNLYDPSVGYEVEFSSVSGSFKDEYNNQKFSGDMKTNFGDRELQFDVETVSGGFKLEDWD